MSTCCGRHPMSLCAEDQCCQWCDVRRSLLYLVETASTDEQAILELNHLSDFIDGKPSQIAGYG